MMKIRNFDRRSKAAYRHYAEHHAPSSPLFADCIRAFAVGGAICALGQGIFDASTVLGAKEETAKTAVCVALIALSCLFTALGLYGKLAVFAKAGTLVPITGFANAVCASAIDARAEGFVTGACVKMFDIAGPVIVCGNAASVLWGLVYYIMKIRA